MHQEIPFIDGSKLELVLDRIFDILVTESANQQAKADESGKAKGQLTLAIQPTDGDIFTVDSKTYILQDTLVNTDGNIQIGADLLATQINIVAAFDLSGTAGVDYATLMTAHPTVDIEKFSTLTVNNATLTAKTQGLGGNSIVTTATFADALNFFDAATLGSFQVGKVVDITIYDFAILKEVHTPLDALKELNKPLVTVYWSDSEVDMRTNKTYHRTKNNFHIDIYAQANSDDDTEGLTFAALKVHRLMMQVYKILTSPMYENLGFPYKDSNGNNVKFIEKRGIDSMQKFQPESSQGSVENVIASRIIFQVQMEEDVFDLQGSPIIIIETLVEAETQ